MKYLKSIVKVSDGFVNTFEEESYDILALDLKEIATHTALKALVEHSRCVSDGMSTLKGKDQWKEESPLIRIFKGIW